MTGFPHRSEPTVNRMYSEGSGGVFMVPTPVRGDLRILLLMASCIAIS